MKKQIKKLSLNKKTISNLSASEMSRQMGGSQHICSDPHSTRGGTCRCTRNGNTCYAHNTCQYTCA